MKTSSRKIIIVGAGMAGLACANHLQAKGFDVTILEARDRCGGRVWSEDSLGLTLDRGAAWIHGAEGNPITELARRFKANIQPVDFSRFISFDREGQEIPTAALQEFNQGFDEKLKQAQSFALQAEQDLSLAAALAPFFNPADLPPRQQDLFKRKLAYFEGYIGQGYEGISARFWDQEVTLPGDNYIFAGSYRPVIEGLAQACRIEKKVVVKAVHEGAQAVELLTDRGSYFADAVLLTVPLSVLKQKALHFDPPLPPFKQQAIDRLGMGLFNVAAFKFPRLFWPQETQAFFFSGFDADSISVFINYYHFKGEPVLIGYSGGEKARRLEQFSDQALLAKTMTNLRRQFGAQVPDPEGCFFTRWSQDPFSLGSYSYLPIGASAQDREDLAKPASKRLFFAGEATQRDYPATTHGAYWSGLREAERIADSFKV